MAYYRILGAYLILVTVLLMNFVILLVVLTARVLMRCF